jgi:hypothetical protein
VRKNLKNPLSDYLRGELTGRETMSTEKPNGKTQAQNPVESSDLFGAFMAAPAVGF